ncbi:hypothetical protein B7463_g10359, partial [Scytalidium lignicola]
MAKRKRNPTPTQQVWEVEDVVELIAWLNHTVQHDELEFDMTVLEYLQKSRDKYFTLRQVNSKLSRLWDSYGSNELPDKKWTELFNQGSSILTRLNEEVIKDIEEASSRLEEKFSSGEHRTRRSQRLQPPMKSKSRSISTIRMDEDDDTNLSLRPRSSVEQSNPSVSSFTINITTNRNDLIRKTSVKSPERNKSECQAISSTEATSTEYVDVKPYVGKPPSTVNDSQDSNSDQEILCIENRRNRGNTNCTNKRSRTVETLNQPKRKGPHQNTDNDKLSEASHQTQLEDASATIKELQERLCQKEDELLEEKRKVDRIWEKNNFLSLAQKQRDKNSGGAYEQLIEEKDQYIRELEKKLRDRLTLGRFTKIRATHERFEKERVTDNFMSAHYYGKQFTIRHSTSKMFSIPDLERYPELERLVYEALGVDMNVGLLSKETIKSALSELSPQAIVRAVIGSTLRNWVYETDFPGLDLTHSKLLEMYQRQLVTQGMQLIILNKRDETNYSDGAIALRNLELSSHSALMESEEFRNRLIPKIAEPLAIKLSQILAPFYTKHLKTQTESSYDGFAAWGENRNDWKERQRQFVDMFTKALTAKADSLLNTENYEIVIEKPGTPFDPKTMTAESTEGIPILSENLGDTTNATVDICVQAGLYSYPKTSLTDESPMEEALIQKKNFIRTSRESRSSLKQPLIKAVVVLGKGTSG